MNKLFTTAWPLQIFVQVAAGWAHKHKWSVIAHIPKERNIWADQLSRGNTAAFKNRPQFRVRFAPHSFWPRKSALILRPHDAPWRPEQNRTKEGASVGPLAQNPKVGVSVQASHGDAGQGDGHALSSLPQRSRTFWSVGLVFLFIVCSLMA